MNVEVYNRQLDIPSATAFLKGLRFMVQDYIMGGLITQRTAKEWVNGWQSSIFDPVQRGDFFLGTDKDLDKSITPIFNTNAARVSQAVLKVNSGSNKP